MTTRTSVQPSSGKGSSIGKHFDSFQALPGHLGCFLQKSPSEKQVASRQLGHF